MTERELEQKWLKHGTVKKKADLLLGIDLSPNKLRHAVKKFGEPIPQLLADGEDYAGDLFDFLLDFDAPYYEKMPESKFRERLTDYVYHEIWQVKHKTRNIEDNICTVALDMRKALKDHATNIAQISGRVVKNVADGLPAPEKKELRELIQKSADEVMEKNFGRLLSNAQLLTGDDIKQIEHPKKKDKDDDDPDKEPA